MPGNILLNRTQQYECSRSGERIGRVVDGDAFRESPGTDHWVFQLRQERRPTRRVTVPERLAGPSGTFTVDNTAPTINISGPSASLTIGGPVTYTVTYADLNFEFEHAYPLPTSPSIPLARQAPWVEISGDSGTVRTVALSGITGDGTLGISIGAGTATDTAGNSAPAAGPSTTFTVDNTAPTVVSINRLKPGRPGGQSHEPDLSCDFQ